jgi:hypothetical protein
MRERVPAPPVTALIVVRAIAGATLLVFPRRVLGVLPGHRSDPPIRTAARVIGARDLGEAAMLGHRPTRRRVRIGAGIDAIHSASMVALAIASPKYRAPALSSALGAVALAGAGAWVAATRTAIVRSGQPAAPGSGSLIGRG